MREAAQIIGSHRLDDCDIYVTLEPCAMCAAAISLARIRRIYYAASDVKFGAIENGQMMRSSSCYHQPEIYSGFCAEESAQLLKDFLEKNGVPYETTFKKRNLTSRQLELFESALIY